MKRALVLLAALGAACSTAARMTESEEYYVGRSVAADVVSRYPYVEDASLTEYVSRVGYAVALSSERPMLYGGYHFAVLQSDEINAFAGPGGFVFITTGALRAMRNEEELAGVLAHEIAHVVLRHPDRAAQAAKNRQSTSEVIAAIAGAASQSGDADLAQVASVLEDVTNDVLLDIIEKGYSRDQEHEADALALRLLSQVGYDARGLREFVSRLQRVDTGFSWGGSTHPAPGDRVERMDEILPDLPTRESHDVRTREFLQHQARLR